MCNVGGNQNHEEYDTHDLVLEVWHKNNKNSNERKIINLIASTQLSYKPISYVKDTNAF